MTGVTIRPNRRWRRSVRLAVITLSWFAVGGIAWGYWLDKRDCVNSLAQWNRNLAGVPDVIRFPPPAPATNVAQYEFQDCVLRTTQTEPLDSAIARTIWKVAFGAWRHDILVRDLPVVALVRQPERTDNVLIVLGDDCDKKEMIGERLAEVYARAAWPMSLVAIAPPGEAVDLPAVRGRPDYESLWISDEGNP